MAIDLKLALANHSAPCEGVPRGADSFDWARSPVTVMGCNPTAAGLPSWYSGERYPEWPRIIVWFTAYREAGSPVARNTRVAVRNLELWIKSRATGQWTHIDSNSSPHGGAQYAENMSGANRPWADRTEPDGSMSIRPDRDYCAHGWGSMRDINVSDIAGVYASVQHRVVSDNPFDTESRLTDRWVVNVGVDYYPPEGKPYTVLPGAFSGRYVRSITDWRSSYGAVIA